MNFRQSDVFSNWDTAVNSVNSDISERISTYASDKPSTGLSASQERVSGADSDPDNKTMLSWFFDWGWVHRRVENIRVLDNAQTRRHFSFDVALPFSPELRRLDRDGKPTGQVNVPLTFLRRGMLVNLDIRDSEDWPMPTITSSENLEITYRAVKQLTARVNLGELMRKMMEENAGGSEPGRNYDKIVDDAILSLINTHGMDHGHFNNRTVDRHQEDHRHQLFESLGQIVHSLHPEGISGAEHTAAVIRLPKMVAVPKPDAETVEKEQGESDFTKWRRAAWEKLREMLWCPRVRDHEYVLDTSLPVELLARTILFAVDIREESDRPDIRDEIDPLDLELLCIMLATVSYSYLLCIVADESEMWRIPSHGVDGHRTEKIPESIPADPPKGAAAPVSRRTVVKLVCDVEPDDIPLNIFNPTRKVLVRYSQTTARSTHLEFSPPEKAVAQSITAPVVVHLNDPTSTDFPVQTVPFDPGFRTSDERADLNRDGFYRSSQSRVHVEPPLKRTDPVRTLRIALTPEQRWQPWAATVVAAVVVILCVLLHGGGSWGFPDNPLGDGENGADDFNGNLSVFFALETLLAAAFGALFFTTGSHRLSRKVGGPSLVAVGLAWGAASLSPVALLAEPYGAGSAYWLIWICSFVLLLLSFGGATMISWSSRRPHGNVERIIRREGRGPWWIRMFDSPVRDRRSVLSVTETGAFDCHYLTDPAHRQELADRSREVASGLSGPSGTVTPHD